MASYAEKALKARAERLALRALGITPAMQKAQEAARRNAKKQAAAIADTDDSADWGQEDDWRD